MKRLPTATLLVCSALLSACGGLIPQGQAPTTGAMSTASSAASRPLASPVSTADNSGRSLPPPIVRSPARMASAPQDSFVRPEEMSCISELNAAGARFNPLPDTYAAPGCNKLGTVQLLSLSGDGGQFGISNIGAVKCSVANAFSGWVRYGVDRAARQILGSGLKQVVTMGSYACRNVAGTDRRSGHARAEAIDVSAFILEDGRTIVLKEDWDNGSAAEREFLRVVHKSACKRFGTVLGPEYNDAHKDHFHLEEGGGKFCR
jgi:hypothetical protein